MEEFSTTYDGQIATFIRSNVSTDFTTEDNTVCFTIDRELEIRRLPISKCTAYFDKDTGDKKYSETSLKSMGREEQKYAHSQANSAENSPRKSPRKHKQPSQNINHDTATFPATSNTAPTRSSSPKAKDETEPTKTVSKTVLPPKFEFNSTIGNDDELPTSTKDNVESVQDSNTNTKSPSTSSPTTNEATYESFHEKINVELDKVFNSRVKDIQKQVPQDLRLQIQTYQEWIESLLKRNSVAIAGMNAIKDHMAEFENSPANQKLHHDREALIKFIKDGFHCGEWNMGHLHVHSKTLREYLKKNLKYRKDDEQQGSHHHGKSNTSRTKERRSKSPCSGRS